MACATHPDRESIARCVTCGAELCAECGHDVGGRYYCAVHAPAAPGPPPPAETPEAAPAAEAVAPSPDNPTLAACAYVLPAVLPVVGLVLPIIVLATDAKKSRFMRFHALHAIFLSLGYLVLMVALAIAMAILGHAPVIGPALSRLVWRIVPLAWLVLNIILAVKAYNRRELTIPVVTQMARDQADKMGV